MASRDQVLQLLDDEHSYETAARQLGISPGLAFMIDTESAADGSSTSHPEELREERGVSGSSQHLVNPPALNPTRNQAVIDWVVQRAAHELTRAS